MNYKDYNDYELLYVLNENEEIREILYSKYKYIIIHIANDIIKKYGYIGIEINDLLQEGYLALYNATNTYDSNLNTTFFTYACKCIINRMYTYLNKNNSVKYRPLNNSVSYNTNDMTYDDKIINISINKLYDPLNILIENELSMKILNDLIGYEKDIFICRRLGLKNRDIMKVLGVENRVVINALSRIRYKFKNYYSDYSE